MSCNKNYLNKVDEESKKRFRNTFNFSNNDINKFRKGVYPYEFIVEWKMFNEISLSRKEDSYSNLNIEHITDADYMTTRRSYEDFKIKNLGEHHYLYFKSDTLVLADIFGNFTKMCSEIYKLDLARFPGLNKNFNN